jgi:hypothetical protein
MRAEDGERKVSVRESNHKSKEEATAVTTKWSTYKPRRDARHRAWLIACFSTLTRHVNADPETIFAVIFSEKSGIRRQSRFV